MGVFLRVTKECGGYSGLWVCSWGSLGTVEVRLACGPVFLEDYLG